MGKSVNLDALILREDFEVVSTDALSNSAGLASTIKINDLGANDFFFLILRKADFQRETNEWSPTKICEFIESFLDGDLIPAIILWKSQSNIVFVLDGAHRLSVISAWINDDYGDGIISKQFYNNEIPVEQKRFAEKTRKLVNKRIGAYKDFKLALEYPNKSNIKILKRARALGSLALETQWVKGDASNAEKSFFKINQKASRINTTELKILQARKTPNAIAARAIIRAGTGHKYWCNFSNENQTKIEETAREIYNILFHPPLEQKINTSDLPIGGKNYSSNALTLVFQSINIIIGKTEDIDLDGSKTIDVLIKCLSVFRMINSTSTSSLGLHPLVYFYSHKSGNYQMSSFMAIVSFILELKTNNLLNDFIRVREDFEEFLILYNYFIEQIILKYGSGVKSHKHLKSFFLFVFKHLSDNINIETTVNSLVKSQQYNFLKMDSTEKTNVTSIFSTKTKNGIYIRESIKNLNKCQICNGYIHKNSIVFDHKKRIKDGGLGTIENGQLSHPYCNSVIKR